MWWVHPQSDVSTVFDVPVFTVRCVGSFISGATVLETVARLSVASRILRALHDAGFDLAARDCSGKCALAIELERVASLDSIASYQLALTEQLISLAPECCVAVDDVGVMPVTIASACGLVTVVTAMLAVIGSTRISRALPKGDVFPLLPNEAAAANGEVEVLRILTCDASNVFVADAALTPLHVAAAFGRTEAVALLLGSPPAGACSGSAAELLMGAVSSRGVGRVVALRKRPRSRGKKKLAGDNSDRGKSMGDSECSMFSPVVAALAGAEADMSKYSFWCGVAYARYAGANQRACAGLMRTRSAMGVFVLHC